MLIKIKTRIFAAMEVKGLTMFFVSSIDVTGPGTHQPWHQLRPDQDPIWCIMNVWRVKACRPAGACAQISEGLTWKYQTCIFSPFFLQTITGAMSTINPPVQLADSSSQFRVDYIQDVASQPDFDYPTVSRLSQSTSYKIHLVLTPILLITTIVVFNEFY